MNTQGTLNKPVRIIMMPTVHIQSARQFLTLALIAIVVAVGAEQARASSRFLGGSYDGFDTLSVTNQGIPQPLITVLGTNGVALADGATVSPDTGAAFGTCATNAAITNWFVVTNSGAIVLTLSTPTKSGAGADQFKIGDMPSSLAAGTASNFWITFAPSAVGIQTALVSIANSSTTTPFRINISGTGTGVELSPGTIGLSPVSLNFTATYGANPADQFFTVTNGVQLPFGYTNALAYASGPSGWLTINAPSGYVATAGSQIHTGQVNIAGLIPGTYTATNTVGSTNAANSPQSLVVTLTVAKATPSITWANPATITYGTALDGTQLNANPSVAGSLTYTPASGTLLNPGTNQDLRVILTPDDSSLYNTVTSHVAISVNPVIVATAGLHGTIVPSGPVVVPFGGSTNFVMTVSDSRYKIGSVLSNGVAVDAAIGLQVFTSQWYNVTGNGSVAALFNVNRFVGGSYDGFDNSLVSSQGIPQLSGSVYTIR